MQLFKRPQIIIYLSRNQLIGFRSTQYCNSLIYVLTALPSPSIRQESTDEVVDGEGPGLGSNNEAWCRSVYTECDGKGWEESIWRSV